jgi:transcriptional regulator with XRE-family HTH domain
MLTQEEYVQRVLELKRQGWSVRELAAEVGYHPATVSKWLKAGGPPDKRSVNPSERVAAALVGLCALAGCSNSHDDKAACGAERLRPDALEDAVLAALVDLYSDPEFITRALRIRTPPRSPCTNGTTS